MFFIRSLTQVNRLILKAPRETPSMSGTIPIAFISFIRHKSTAAVRPRPAQTKRLKTPIESYVPPIALLESGRKAGALEIEPVAAQLLIRKYAESSINKPAGGKWEEQFFRDEGVTARTLTILSLIVARSADAPRKSMGKRLLLCASRLGDPSATIFIMTSALDAQMVRNPDYAAALTHLTSLAQPPDENPAAMVLLGRIFAAENKEEKALELFRRVAGMNLPSQEERNPILPPKSPFADALVAQGLILQKRADLRSAENAFRDAALEHDSPAAYFHLAQLLGPPSLSYSPSHSSSTASEYETFLLKASSSGISEAAVLLGKLYHEHATIAKGKMGERSITSPQQARLAKEWLYLAAAGGDPGSMILLGDLLSLEGDTVAGGAWVARAGEVVDVAGASKEEAVGRARNSMM